MRNKKIILKQDRSIHGFGEAARQLLTTLSMENLNAVQTNVNPHIENILSFIRRREIGPVVRIFLTDDKKGSPKRTVFSVSSNSYVYPEFVNRLDDSFII